MPQVSPAMAHFVQVRFRNYKAFPDFVINLREFNVLVGPNNAGESTALGAFRILSEAYDAPVPRVRRWSRARTA